MSRLVFFLCSTALVFAQSNTGSLSGRVVDPSNSVIAGAKVIATGDTTGVRTEAITNAEGFYVFPNLQVGPYTISVEQAGFKKLEQRNLNIAIANRSIFNITLSVGDLSQAVEVTTQPPLLATETSDTGTQFQPKLMKDAPLFVSGGFRNPENFISFMPGVNNGVQDSSINGGSQRSKEILIDGASHTNPESGGTAFVANGGIGAVEMYGEFKLLTSNFSAEYGRTGGGVEIFVTKSGTNDFHGTAFDFLRNDKLDAAGWAVNSRRPFLGKSKVRQNEYGFAVGGPVWIPKLYNGRNKTFWFFTWNGYKQNNAVGTGVATVPTALMKQGNFSELGSKKIYDPVSGLPFEGNIIPQDRWSSVSKNMLSLIPDPTSPGISNNFATVNSNIVDRNIYSIKIDHAFSDRNRISGLYNWQRLIQTAQSGLPGPLASGNVTSDTPDISRLNHDFNFTPTLFNHATFGLSRYQNVFVQLDAQRDQNWPDQLGLTGVATDDASSFPVVTFTDNLTQFGNNPKTIGAQQNWTYEFNDGVTWLKGRHEFKMGYLYHRGRTFQSPADQSGVQGIFNFSSFQTANPALRSDGGYSFASFLLGGVDSGQRYYYGTKDGVNNIFQTHSLYFNDNFKVNSRLTLNLGLRYEIYVPRTDTNLTLSAFDPNLPNPGAGGLLGALSFAGEGPGRNGRVRFGDIYWNNFGPRIGFALRVTDKTVFRGGYGMYYSAANGNTGGGCFPCGWGTSASPTTASPGGVAPAFNWDGGFQPPAGFQPPPIIDPSYANAVGTTVNTVLMLSKEDGLAGRIQNWQFNVQQELPFGLLLDAAYLGSYSTRLNSYVPYNQVDPKYLSLGPLLAKKITDPEVIAAGFTKPYASFPDNQTLAQALRPYPQYGNVIHTYLGQGASSYNAMQVKLEKRYSAVTLMAGYTWSKTISINGAFTQTGNGTGPQDQYNLDIEKSLSRFDIPHTLNVVYTWDLPFGKGRKYLSSANGFMNAVVGGWTIAGIHQYRSGTLIAIGAPVNTLGNGVLFTPALRANTTGQAISLNTDRTSLDPNDPSSRWLNRDAFSIPGAYQFGNAAPYLNDVRNPALLTESFSLVKRTYIREQMNVEFRADMSNIFNRTSFGGINVNLSDPNFGRPTGVQQNPRIIQLGLRFNF